MWAIFFFGGLSVEYSLSFKEDLGKYFKNAYRKCMQTWKNLLVYLKITVLKRMFSAQFSKCSVYTVQAL